MSQEYAPLLRAIGLCARARALITGVPMVLEAMRGGKDLLVLSAQDISENTRKQLSDKTTYYGVRMISLPIDTQTLAHAVGKTGCLGAVAVRDDNMRRLVLGALEKISPQQQEEQQ